MTVWSLFLVSGCLAFEKTNFVVGGWQSGTPEQASRNLKPLFETYLFQEVGALYDPPLKFTFVPVDYSKSNSYKPMVESGVVDFMYTRPSVMICSELQYGWIPIATQRVLANGFETGREGLVIYSLMSNPGIQNMTDLKDKKIGVGHVLLLTSYHFGMLKLRAAGVDLFSDVNQFIFYGIDYERQYRDVSSGVIDAGMVPSTWMAKNHAADLGLLRIHGPLQVSFESEPFPFVTSTDLNAQSGLTASPAIPWSLKRRVVNALTRLNASHPAMKTLGLSTFTVPGSNGLGRSVMELVGTVQGTNEPGGTRHCVDHWDPEDHWESINCPQGFVKIPVNDSLTKCAVLGLKCPSGLLCFCRPCVPDPMVNFFNWQLVLGLCVALAVSGALLSMIYSLTDSSCDLSNCGRRVRSRMARRAGPGEHSL